MKKIKLSIYSGLFILWISFQLNAQVKTDFNNTERITLSGKFNKRYQQLKSSIIPARDIQSLLRRDSLDDLTPEPKPYRIAEPISADIDVVKNAAWIQDESYAYGKYTIYAQGAKSISVNFDQFKLPKGTELYIYNKEGEMISGPVSELETNEENTWGTWVYKGDELTLDFRVPLQATDSLSLHIDNVAYGYKDIYRTEVGGFGDSSPCNVNVLCPLGNGWGEETNSVALILNSNGSAMCSGALINNTCNLNIPYFLTANHCFTSNSNVGGWRFTFQAWSPTCSPTQNANGITFFGSTLRARNAGSDFCLVELNQAIGSSSGLTYAGWSRNTNGIQQTTIIHHPAGDVMKISRDNQPPVFDNFQNAQVWRLVLDQGATNGGSSGGPYFDQNHRIIAQHYGTLTIDPNPCFNSRKYGGRFDLSWNGGGTNATRLSNWLDPVNTGALTTNTRRIPFINGPSLVCANATFVLQNQWPGTTVTWSSNSSSGLNVNPTTGVATRQGSFSGPVTITATVAGIGPCNAINFTKVVHVGNPTFTNPKVDGSNFYIGSCHGVCPGFHTASLTINGAAPDLMSWTLNPGGAVSWGWDQYNSQIVFETLPYYTQYPFSFVGNISNSCGPAQFTFCFISGPNCQSQVWFNPNPVDDELVLTRGVAEGEASSDLESVEVSLHNSSMENVFSKNTNERIIKIPVIELPEGNYFLRIHTKAGVIQEQIIIKR